MADLNYGAVHESSVRATQTERYIGQIYGDNAEIITAGGMSSKRSTVSGSRMSILCSRQPLSSSASASPCWSNKASRIGI